MALPVPANSTCDIYRNGAAPPGEPAVSGIAIYFKPDWIRGQQYGVRLVNDLTWTHQALMDLAVDIRDCYAGDESTNNLGDTIYIPDKNGTGFKVVFIEAVNIGLASVHKRVYLDRQTPNWPTNVL